MILAYGKPPLKKRGRQRCHHPTTFSRPPPAPSTTTTVSSGKVQLSATHRECSLNARTCARARAPVYAEIGERDGKYLRGGEARTLSLLRRSTPHSAVVSYVIEGRSMRVGDYSLSPGRPPLKRRRRRGRVTRASARDSLLPVEKERERRKQLVYNEPFSDE